jgi:iron uptake system EfeUOB component EfeO/EfeM
MSNSVRCSFSTHLLRHTEEVDIKMSNLYVNKMNISVKAKESFLSYQPKAWKQQHWRKIKWLNVQNAEPK